MCHSCNLHATVVLKSSNRLLVLVYSRICLAVGPKQLYTPISWEVLLQMLLSKVSCNFIFQTVVGLPVPPKPHLVTAGRGASTLSFEMIEHLFHLQGDETATLRRKWSEKVQKQKAGYRLLFCSGESCRLQTGDTCSLMEITSYIPRIKAYYAGFNNEGERKGKELKSH